MINYRSFGISLDITIRKPPVSSFVIETNPSAAR